MHAVGANGAPRFHASQRKQYKSWQHLGQISWTYYSTLYRYPEPTTAPWTDILNINRLRGRVVKGMGHLDHVWSYGVREVDRGNIVGWVFHPTRWLVRFSHLNMPFLQNSEFNTVLVNSNYRPSAPILYQVASYVKKTAIPAIIIIIYVFYMDQQYSASMKL